MAAFALLVLLSVSGCSDQAAKQVEVETVNNALPIEIIDYSFVFRAAGPYTAFSALVINPNSDVTIDQNDVDIIAVDDDDVVLGQYTLSVFSLAPNTQGVLEATFDGDVKDVEISVLKPSSTSKGSSVNVIPESSFSKIDFEYYPHYDAGTATAALTIPNDPTTTQVNACVAIFSAKGKFLAGDCDVHDVIPGRKNGLDIYIFLPPGSRPGEVKYFATYY